MIVPPGVLVEEELASDVARLLGDGIRREPARDSVVLRRLLAELSSVSARTSVASVPSTPTTEVWLDTTEAARRLGVDPRTVRRRAESGSLEAMKEDGKWRIQI